jgi:hypothetical protein
LNGFALETAVVGLYTGLCITIGITGAYAFQASMIAKANLSDGLIAGIFAPDLLLLQNLLHWRLTMQAWGLELVNGYTSLIFVLGIRLYISNDVQDGAIMLPPWLGNVLWQGPNAPVFVQWQLQQF